jgi:hypothetical protein
MKKIILLILTVLTLSFYGQLTATGYGSRPLSVFNNMEFFYNVTSPHVNLNEYLLEKDFSLDIKNSTETEKFWMYNKDTLKQLFLIYVDCSVNKDAWCEVAADVYTNEVGMYFLGSYYTAGRNVRKFWLVDVTLPIDLLTYEILVMIIPHGQPIYEKDFNENERFYKKYIN